MRRDTARAMWKELRGWPAVLLLTWLVVMLSMPLVNQLWGDSVFYPTISLSVLLQAALGLLLLARVQGVRRTLLTAAIVGVLAWGLEAVGSSTGFPFGSYHYTDRLQPQLLHVPLLIPAAWMMMLPPAWAVGKRLAGQRSRLLFVALSALAFTAWDLFLDPQMVRWGLWVWDQPGGYFGIPWINYAGWFLGSALITAVASPKALPERPLVLVYVATWVLETVGLLAFWGLPGPAVCGFVGMGVFILAVWRAK